MHGSSGVKLPFPGTAKWTRQRILIALVQFGSLPCIFTVAAPAQNQPGFAVSGMVLDPQRAFVPGVTIFLEQSDRKDVRSTTTNSQGTFQFEMVAPGSYRIRVERTGFKSSLTAVTVRNQALAPLRILLELAEVRQELTVSSDDSTQVSTAASANQNIVSLNRSALDDLPIFDQNFISAMSQFLDPGSTGTNGITLVVDGVEATRAGVSASAIQQVSINQDPYSAQYPSLGRNRIEIVTKPGAPEYHGTFNFLFRDSVLNARDAFALTKPPEQRRIFEGILSGPLGGSKKTSFLISGNREEQDAQAVVVALGPAGAIRETAPTPQRNTELSGGVNHQIRDNDLISLRGVYTDRTVRNQGVGGFTLPEAGADYEDREDLLFFNYTSSWSKHWLQQFRTMAARQHTPTRSVNSEPRTAVLGAFTGGGAQGDRLQTENHVIFTEIISWTGTKHTIRTGINVPDWSRRGLDDFTNFGGTYTFSTLQDYEQARPLSLLRQAGNGHVVFLEKVVGGFLLDEFRMRPNLQVSAGLRYDWQNYFHDSNNFAPRLSLAYAVGKSRQTVIRAGAGFFYDRTGPLPIFDLIRYDGVRLLQYLISSPSFPQPQTAGFTNIVRLEPDIRIPYTLQYSAGVERQLARGTTVSVTYTGMRGTHLFRSRDINAPRPPLYGVRPNPGLGVSRQIESAGDLESHSLEVGLRGSVTRYFTGMVQYTLARAYNNVGSAPSGGGRMSGITFFPANNYDLAGEWSRSDFDQRNRLSLLGTLTPARYVKLGVSFSAYSGQPYSETTGRDDNHDGLPNDRPPGVPRNSLQGPGYVDLDLRWSHDFFLAAARKDKGPTATLGLDAFNIWNKVNYAAYVGNLSSPFFGYANSAQPPRRLQLSFRFRF